MAYHVSTLISREWLCLMTHAHIVQRLNRLKLWIWNSTSLAASCYITMLRCIARRSSSLTKAVGKSCYNVGAAHYLEHNLLPYLDCRHTIMHTFHHVHFSSPSTLQYSFHYWSSTTSWSVHWQQASARWPRNHYSAGVQWTQYRHTTILLPWSPLNCRQL